MSFVRFLLPSLFWNATPAQGTYQLFSHCSFVIFFLSTESSGRRLKQSGIVYMSNGIYFRFSFKNVWPASKVMMLLYSFKHLVLDIAVHEIPNAYR